MVSPFCAPGVELPVLAHITLDSGFAFPNPPNERRLPSVRTLALTPCENGNIEVYAALVCCPQLETLRLDIRGTYNVFSAPPSANLCALALRPQFITVVSLRGLNADWALQAFSEPHRRSLALESGDGSLLGWDIVDDLIVKSPADAVSVRLVYDARKSLSMRATASDGRVRNVTLHSCNDPSIHLRRILIDISFTKCKVQLIVNLSLREYVSTMRCDAPAVELIYR
ncbi:hypothetical protein AURDEDRAFT_112173 [Auricularia subglabra TFB-10046 SS5]|nr:hypothetical protein AURDEDRAFT_112173 [Auricularia subglabra TFB-10046 SS5]